MNNHGKQTKPSAGSVGILIFMAQCSGLHRVRQTQPDGKSLG